MPFAGFAAARGDLDIAWTIGVGAAGSVLGTLPWYWAGARIGEERLKRWAARHERVLTVSPDELERAQRWFRRHGGAAVFLGRLVPALRSIISAPAGVCRMPLPRFLAWSSAGSLLWCGALAAVGFLLEARHDIAARWIDVVTWAILGSALAAYAWRFFHPKSRRQGHSQL
jgi:membrane protein DedA with SNARE-associated domain